VEGLNSSSGLSVAISLIAIIISVAGVLITIYEVRSKVAVNTSTSLKNYAETIEAYATRAETIREKMETVEKEHTERISRLHQEHARELAMIADKYQSDMAIKSQFWNEKISSLETRINVMNEQIADLIIQKDQISKWAKKLSNQIKSSGDIPSTLEDSKEKP